jgi:hypothetical protein
MEHDVIHKKFTMKRFICFIMIITITALFIISKDASARHYSKPIAVIDGTLNVKEGEKVYLDGTLSSDPGGDSLVYSWTLLSSPNGSHAIISDSSNAHASFDADVAGTYKVKLIVNNGLTDSDPAYAEIRVTARE